MPSKFDIRHKYSSHSHKVRNLVSDLNRLELSTK